MRYKIRPPPFLRSLIAPEKSCAIATRRVTNSCIPARWKLRLWYSSFSPWLDKFSKRITDGSFVWIDDRRAKKIRKIDERDESNGDRRSVEKQSNDKVISRLDCKVESRLKRKSYEGYREQGKRRSRSKWVRPTNMRV